MSIHCDEDNPRERNAPSKDGVKMPSNPDCRKGKPIAVRLIP
jgi:hypothetical protein